MENKTWLKHNNDMTKAVLNNHTEMHYRKNLIKLAGLYCHSDEKKKILARSSKNSQEEDNENGKGEHFFS